MSKYNTTQALDNLIEHYYLTKSQQREEIMLRWQTGCDTAQMRHPYGVEIHA